LAPPPLASTQSPRTTVDDEALIDAVLRGDSRRADELHDRLIGAIEPALYRVLGRREPDHDDLVQATFEQIVITLMRGRFARGCSLSTWASAVAAHVAFNALRARRRARRVFETVSVPDATGDHVIGDAEREIGVRDRIRRAQAHLMAMSYDRAIVLVLHDVLGHELAEIAATLDISIAAAQSRLVRGRRELIKRTQVDEEAPGAGGDRV
jgi:RNA polymerase sigma-70 factor (ECF subfamily)